MLFPTYLILVLLFLCVFCKSIEKKQIFKYIQVCDRNSLTISSCIRRSINLFKPLLRTGIPELGVPSIDPFFIPNEYNTEFQHPGSPSPIQVTLRNLKISGTSDFKIRRLSADAKNLTIRGGVRFPKLRLEGDYAMTTTVLFLTLTNEGRFNAVAENCDTTLAIYPRAYVQNRAVYINFTRVDTDIEIKDYRVTLVGSTERDNSLSNMANNVINSNRAEFLKTMKPYLEKTISNIVLNVANNLVRGFRLDQLMRVPSIRH